jgi:hypothetical protein
MPRDSRSIMEAIGYGALSTPLVLSGRIEEWPARRWTPATLAHGPLAHVQTTFRFARRRPTGCNTENCITCVLCGMI